MGALGLGVRALGLGAALGGEAIGAARALAASIGGLSKGSKKISAGPNVQARWHGPRFMAIAENAVEEAVARAGLRVQIEAIRLVSQAAFPPASKAGEPPRVRTGTLLRSIDQETFRATTADFTARVGSNLKYGFWLETGTRRMAPRPWLRPALDNKRNQIVDEILKAGRSMK